MNIDKSLTHRYDFEILEEPKSGYEIYYYPGASTLGGMDGVIVQINPEHGETWIGIFAFGNVSKNGALGVYTTPHSNKLCVVANGAGYIVSSDNPEKWEEIKSIPIIDARISKAQNLLIFADYTGLIAYNDNGVKWKTRRLAWDNLKIIELSDDYIKGEYFDIRSDRDEFFEVNLVSGISKGGVE
tara:strand:- start:1825 stop:2379 length:555 start_codon:yes stop_codon:yes gene_type:complete